MAIKLVMHGKGTLSHRKLIAVRVRPEVLDRLGALCAGQQYLVVEAALASFCRELESTSETRVMNVDRFEENADYTGEAL